MESRTASSNSIGPGISNDGCAGWFEVFLSVILGAEEVPKYRLGTSLMRGVYGRSSAWSDSLSAEYGVLREGKGGFWSRCLCMRLSRLDARDGARMMEGKAKRPKAVRAANAGIARMTFGQCKCFSGRWKITMEIFKRQWGTRSTRSFLLPVGKILVSRFSI